MASLSFSNVIVPTDTGAIHSHKEKYSTEKMDNYSGNIINSFTLQKHGGACRDIEAKQQDWSITTYYEMVIVDSYLVMRYCVLDTILKTAVYQPSLLTSSAL